MNVTFANMITKQNRENKSLATHVAFNILFLLTITEHIRRHLLQFI